MTNIVAVTGASGGLGRALLRELIRGDTAPPGVVRGGVRDQSKGEQVASLGAEPVVCDVTAPATLDALMSGAEVVHHLAAWMGAPAGRAAAVNVEGTRNVLDAAVRNGVRRVVLASSVAVYGPQAAGHIDESWPRIRTGDAYGDSKVGAEEVAESHPAVRAGELELVVLRPSMIYGPASASWTLTPLGGIKNGLPVVIGSGEGLLDAVYVDDVAVAFARAGAAPGAAGATLNIVGEPVSVNDLFGAYAAMVNRPLRRVPLGLARAGAKVAGAVTGPLPMVDKVVPEMLTTMTSTATFNGEAAAKVIGYKASTPLPTGLSSTAQWLREHGHAPGPRSALVVGAGRGLGLEVASELARRYVRVYAADLPATDAPKDLPSSRAEPDTRSTPGEPSDDDASPQTAGLAGALAVDATSEKSLAAAVAEVERREGHLDLTVTTVGGLRPGALEVQELDDIESQWRLNALAPLLVARAASPGMRQRRRGRIIAVGSTNGLLVTPFMGAYSAGKFALEAFSDALRLELLPFGVEVVLIQPGAMRTGFAAAAKRGLEAEAQRVGAPWADYLRRLRDSSLWGEAGAAEPRQVAATIVAAAFRPRAKARIDGTREVPFLKLFTKLPDALKDRAFIGPLKLGRGRDES